MTDALSHRLPNVTENEQSPSVSAEERVGGPHGSGTSEVDEAVVADVEVNVDSRFIDFSLATPWEQLVADLERAVKAWTRPKGGQTLKLVVIIINLFFSPQIQPPLLKGTSMLSMLELNIDL